MNTVSKTSRVLGIAFVLQFVTSISSGAIVKPAWVVPGNISETMLTIANKPWLMQTTILLDMLTAMGVIFLGAVLFITLRKQDENMALTAMGFFFLEGALHGASKLEAFSLLRISQEYLASGKPAYLQTLGNLAFESMEFSGSALMMLAFCFGGILFYYLLDKSRIVPRALSLWGLIATFPMLVGTLAQIFGYTIPFAFYLPYVPFEFVIGVWILVKGITETKQLSIETPAYSGGGPAAGDSVVTLGGRANIETA
jgi:hypothetical protein